MKFGIIKERKNPPDRRVIFSPDELTRLKNAKLFHKSRKFWYSDFTDAEYTNVGIEVATDISDCDVLFGVKEVPLENLIPNKAYFFFHTIKNSPTIENYYRQF
jgi:alanine dehydrogenase